MRLSYGVSADITVQSGIASVDGVLQSMRNPDPAMRPTAWVAMMSLIEILGEIPPKNLKVPPILKMQLPPGIVGEDSNS